MPTFHSLHTESVVPAGGAILAHRFVGFDGEQADAVGQKVLGVARAAGAVGEAVPVDTHGRLMVEAGGAIGIGDGVVADAQGRAVAAAALAVAVGATGVASTAANGEVLTGGEPPQHVFAHAMTAATGAGQFIEILA